MIENTPIMLSEPVPSGGPLRPQSSAYVEIPWRVAALSQPGRFASSSLQPVRFGAPCPRGRILSPELEALLLMDNGEIVPAQAHWQYSWEDGSLRWAVVHAMCRPKPGSEGILRLRESVSKTAEDVARTNCDSVVCGPALLTFRKDESDSQKHAGLANDQVNAVSLLAECWDLIDREGRRLSPRFTLKPAKHQGSICRIVWQLGHFAEYPGIFLNVRWCVYPIHGLARCDVELHNSKAAKHPGGLWDLGDAGSFFFKAFQFRLAPPSPTAPKANRKHIQLEPAGPDLGFSESCLVYQDSSGGEHWDSTCHVNFHGDVVTTFRGFRGAIDDRSITGLHASPVLSADWSTAVRLRLVPTEFWQNFPKSLQFADDVISLGLFPEQLVGSHELQGGESKRHTFWMSCHPAQEVGMDMSWVESPLAISVQPQSLQECKLISSVQPAESKAFECFHTLLSEGLYSEKGLFARREKQDEFGWRNFGDVVADHESVYYNGAEPFISHYNNQFDMILGFLLQFLRTNEAEYFQLADQLARHVMDIDIYHTLEDRAAYCGGLFWFTDHYLTAHTSTHRTYSAKNAPAGKPYGGGPSSEHNFSEGLLLYHLLTGCPRAARVVTELADWVVRSEDGRDSWLGLLDDGPTGLATAGQALPQRGGANSISVLLDGFAVTGRQAYVDMAEALMRRCIHPQDDVQAMDLLDAEHKWSYTMFLSSLCKYMDRMEIVGRTGIMYEFAKQSLLRYALWMLDHERPTLSNPHALEYPTEAWAAQDLRKANVLRKAAEYADEATAALLVNRSVELADSAWSDLMAFPETRMNARSLALVMTEGLYDCAGRGTNVKNRGGPLASHAFGARVPFQDRKSRIKARCKSPAGLLSLGVRWLSPAKLKRWLHFNRRDFAMLLRDDQFE